MGTLLDLASLVMIPSGYKEDKLYSVKPTDGSGDLDFTRSNDTATRVNSAGLIEKVRTNLITYSEDWTNAAWNKTNATVTANATTNPIDGAATADAIFETTTNGQHNFFQIFSATVGTEVTISFYAKANGRTKLRMNNGSSAITAAFDLTAVTASMLAGTGTPTITSVGSGWYRCSIRYNALNVSEYVAMNFRNDTDQDVYAGDITKGMFFFGGQAETGVATDYIPTTTTAVSVGMTANVPRLDYSGGGCPKLLLEPSATTLMTYSESLDNAAWDKTSGGAAITANSVTSPDGYTNADTITGTGSGVAFVLVRQTIAVPSAATYTFSGFFKYNNHPFVSLNLSAYDGGGSAYYNIQTGVVGTVSAGASATITDYGNGWYRCTLTAAIGASDLNGRPSVYVAYEDGTSDFPTTAAATGKSAYAWGMNLTQSSYATSYIPTLGAASTRGQDSCLKTGISSLIGQTEGTMFIDTYVGDETDEVYGWLQASLSGNPNDSIQINRASSSVQCQIYNGASVDGFITGGTIATGQRIKIAVGYKQNDVVLYLNGTQIGVDTSTNIPTCAVFQVGAYPPLPNDFTNNGGINQALLFPTRLTNTQLAELTTP